MKGILQLFTDAKDRPEIKYVLGTLGFIASFVYLFVTKDIGGFSAAAGVSVGLFVTGAVGDSVVDKSGK
jgi:hypothetical protein